MMSLPGEIRELPWRGPEEPRTPYLTTDAGSLLKAATIRPNA
jgi:hypothetical protein